MSDNGSPFPRNKGRLYDSGIKSPLIIYGPDINQGTITKLVSAVDIAPTIMALAGVDKSPRMQGVDFSSTWKNNGSSDYRDFVFAEHNWHVFQAPERMVRYKDWVYIRNSFPERQNLVNESTRQFPAGEELWDAFEKGRTIAQQEGVFIQPRMPEELYNVQDDPNQFKNLVNDKDCAKMLSYLRKVMDQWIEDRDSVPQNPTPDRDDLYGKRLPKTWKKGERTGAAKHANQIDRKGPIVMQDLI